MIPAHWSHAVGNRLRFQLRRRIRRKPVAVPHSSFAPPLTLDDKRGQSRIVSILRATLHPSTAMKPMTILCVFLVRRKRKGGRPTRSSRGPTDTRTKSTNAALFNLPMDQFIRPCCVWHSVDLSGIQPALLLPAIV